MAKEFPEGRLFFCFRDPNRRNVLKKGVTQGSKYIKEYLVLGSNAVIVNFKNEEVKDNDEAFKEFDKFCNLPAGCWCSRISEFSSLDGTCSHNFLLYYCLDGWVKTEEKIQVKITSKTCYLTKDSGDSYDLFDSVPIRKEAVYNDHQYYYWTPGEGGKKLLSHIDPSLFKDSGCETITPNSDPLPVEFDNLFK